MMFGEFKRFDEDEIETLIQYVSIDIERPQMRIRLI